MTAGGFVVWQSTIALTGSWSAGDIIEYDYIKIGTTPGGNEIFGGSFPGGFSTAGSMTPSFAGGIMTVSTDGSSSVFIVGTPFFTSVVLITAGTVTGEADGSTIDVFPRTTLVPAGGSPVTYGTARLRFVGSFFDPTIVVQLAQALTIISVRADTGDQSFASVGYLHNGEPFDVDGNPTGDPVGDYWWFGTSDVVGNPPPYTDLTFVATSFSSGTWYDIKLTVAV